MNTPFRFRIFVLLVPSFLFQRCGDTCYVTNTYVYYKPVYSTSEAVRNGVRYGSARTITNPGRIYFKDNFLFINETGEGIHVIDNTNPASPVTIGFLKIPGNTDLAISANYLYADSFIDMVMFDLTDITSIREVKRIANVFDHSVSYGFSVLSNGNILTSWEEVKEVNVYESNCTSNIQPWGRYYDDGIALYSSFGAVMPSGSTGSTGIAGSSARFTITKGTLYALDGNQLDVIDIAQPLDPKVGTPVLISSDVETLFPYKDNLFMGSRSGMLIYDLKDPGAPSFVSKYGHMTSCDPVVVDDKYAYVTLRNGNSCQGFSNQLEVIDITNLRSPQLLMVYPMTNPFGLGLDKKLLFVCDGSAGLKIFDANDVLRLDENKLANYPGIQSIDVIPHNNIAMMIAKDGLYQYNYADPRNIHQISKLPIAQ